MFQRIQVVLLIVLGEVRMSDSLIRIACLGDSITRGSGASADEFRWVSRVNTRLEPEGFEVLNFGVSGRTMMDTDRSYRNEEEWTEALASGADIYIIGLGTNDAKDKYWQETQDVHEVYTETYLDMISIIETTAVPQGGDPVIIFCLIPILQLEPKGDWPDVTVINDELPVIIQQMAETNALNTIDLRPGFQFPENEEQDDEDFLWANPDLYDDAIHPNDAGHLVIAQNVLTVLRDYFDIEASPTAQPSYKPTYAPTTAMPSHKPTYIPTPQPSPEPTYSPTTPKPSHIPTFIPTPSPSYSPSYSPTTSKPSRHPTPAPSHRPTPRPTFTPTSFPSPRPTHKPTHSPSTAAPSTAQPTSKPTTSPPTNYLRPSSEPTLSLPPTLRPTTLRPTTGRPTTAAPSTLEPTTNRPTLFPQEAISPTRFIPVTPGPTPPQPTTPRPSSAPSSPPTSLQLIASALVLEGFSMDEFENEAAATPALESAISEVLSGSKCSVTGVKSYSTARRKLLDESSTTQIDFQIEEPASADESLEEISEDITTTLSSAIEDGSFDTAIADAASRQGSSVLAGASVSREASLSVIATDTGAVAATPAPVASSSLGGGKSSKSSGGLSSGSMVLVFLIAAIAIVGLLGAFLVYTLTRRRVSKPGRKDSFNETEARMELFATSPGGTKRKMSSVSATRSTNGSSSMKKITGVAPADDEETKSTATAEKEVVPLVSEEENDLHTKASINTTEGYYAASLDSDVEEDLDAIKLTPTSERADSAHLDVIATRHASNGHRFSTSSHTSTIDLIGVSTKPINPDNSQSSLELLTVEENKKPEISAQPSANGHREIEMSYTKTLPENTETHTGEHSSTISRPEIEMTHTETVPENNGLDTPSEITDDGVPSASRPPREGGADDASILFLD